jgi:hypothetical protein
MKHFGSKLADLLSFLSRVPQMTKNRKMDTNLYPYKNTLKN